MKRILLLTLLAATLPAAAATNRPTLYLIGDSTVNNGTRGQMGWGTALPSHFDTNRLAVVNRARGGRSSRTYYTEGLWAAVAAELKPGDFVLMQFGHNDGGGLRQSPGRASIKGAGEETEEIRAGGTGAVEVVHSYGWYLRTYIREAKAKGATPIVCSLVPRNIWKDGKVGRASGDYGRWAREVAEAEGVPFLDLNELLAARYEALGESRVRAEFFDPEDHTHTLPAGAEFSAGVVAEGLRGLKDSPLAPFLRPAPAAEAR